MTLTPERLLELSLLIQSARRAKLDKVLIETELLAEAVATTERALRRHDSAEVAVGERDRMIEGLLAELADAKAQIPPLVAERNEFQSALYRFRMAVQDWSATQPLLIRDQVPRP